VIGEAFDELSSRRVLLFGGKGGVGKTTISVAAAIHFSRSRDLILFTTDPASNLGDLFDGKAPFRIESLNADRLYQQFLGENLDKFIELGDRGTYLDKDELRRLFELSLPGVDELMAWMRVGELAEENPSAMVVVDTAPTGHTLRMLASSGHFQQLAAALDSMQAKHRDLVRQFTRRSVRDALDEFIDQFEEKARRRRELLADARQSAFIAVALSEPWVVEQTKRLIDEVRRDGIDVPLVILNRTATDCDCSLCIQQQKRDTEARSALAPMRVVDAPRSCLPLDTPDRIDRWSSAQVLSRDSGEGSPTQESRGSFASLRIKDQRLIFLAGKGGVGKTTCSASIALQLAKSEKTTVISVDPAHSLRDVFAREQPPANLTVETIDTREKWRRFRDSIGQEIERAVQSLTPKGVTVAYDTDAMRKLVEIAPPGADELFAITRLADLISDDTQRAIIVDTAPTGHFLRLIDLPKTATEWVKEFMRILLHYRELIPAGSLGEELIRASRSLHALDKMLRSKDCGVIVVTRPERIVVAESKRLMSALQERGMHVTGVIANYVAPENDCKCDREMRGYELQSLEELGGKAVIIERRDTPVTALAELAALVPIS
jgi:arsenite-transporting ATPase